VDVSLAGSVISLMFSGSVIENIIPRQVKDVKGISIEKSVVVAGIIDKKIQAHVKLNQANLSIGTLANLSPGDVIVLEHRVDCPFDLVINGGDKYFTGYLGKRNGNYALKLDSL
jgi:flagellar motor switch protein FliM